MVNSYLVVNQLRGENSNSVLSRHPIVDYLPLTAQHAVVYSLLLSVSLAYWCDLWHRLATCSSKLSFFFVFVVCLYTFSSFAVKKFQATFLADGCIVRLLLLISVEGEAEDPVCCRPQKRRMSWYWNDEIVFVIFFWARGFSFFFLLFFLIRLIDNRGGGKANCYCWWGRMRVPRRVKWL